MSPQELRDELLTALVAGHETTASQLAWAFERLTREPAVVERLEAEIDAGESDEYLTATVHEVNRLTPTIVEVVLRAPAASRAFQPGQFYRLQNYEANAVRVGHESWVMSHELDPMTQAVLDQSLIDKLSAIVHVHRPQGEG